MKPSPIRKLNKRLIYICLMASAIIAIPLIVLPTISFFEKSKEDRFPTLVSHTFAGSPEEAYAISGTANFPKNYAAIREFENEVAKPATKSADSLHDAFARLGGVDKKEFAEDLPSEPPLRRGPSDNPWREARQVEDKRRALDHYEALRSDILFVNKNHPARNESSNQRRPDSLMDAVERSLELSENHLNQNQNDMFFHTKTNETKRGPIGKIKEAIPHMISEGTLIPTILLSEIDTTLPGPILARVSHNIWDSKTGQTILIPQNSKLIGEYESSIGHGQARAQIVWKRIIFPNQQSVNLGSMVGVDKRGTSGTVGSVDNHYDKVALGLVLTTALGGSVRMTQGKYDPHTSSMSQEFGNTLAQETARLGNKITDKMLAIPPTIKVPMGQRLNVFVEQDLSLQPYAG